MKHSRAFTSLGFGLACALAATPLPAAAATGNQLQPAAAAESAPRKAEAVVDAPAKKDHATASAAIVDAPARKAEHAVASVATAPSASGAAKHSAEAAHGKEVHWSYAGEGGPEEWGRLDPAYLVCYTGKQQSPIDIRKTTHKPLPALAFGYHPSKLNVANNGHTVQFNFDPGSVLESDGRKYELVQAHFHVPSEHAVDGKRFPAEFHFVHKSADGKLAVVGVMIAVGPANAGYRKFLSAAPAEKGEERRNPMLALDPSELLPKSRPYVRYDGSLTTPPCSEGVAWHVLSQPVEIAPAQFEQLKRLYSANARPVQRLNDREPIDVAAP